ncbi:Bll5495 protein [plant metagenome]|uniref:Bll5495 protein n=1 Tax=plant metagenome TaxID=1297885 RepID=A0A484PPK5_9ZZZZ
MSMTSLAAADPAFLDDVTPLSAACAHGDAPALFAELDRRMHRSLGHLLCTVNQLDAGALRLHRLYSSNPEAYPPGGSKAKAGTDWGRHVLLEQRVFVGEGEAAIAQSFDDHAAIVALGLRSVINVPVVLAGDCLGTVNFLMADARVTDAKIEAARWAALLALPGFVLAARARMH